MLNLTIGGMPTSSAFAPLASPVRDVLDALGEARWFLGYLLVVQTVFQFLLKTWSETLEVLLFVLITGGFLVATYVLKGFRGLVGIAADTWTQRLAALFLGALAVSFLWGDQSVRSVLALLRLPTYLIVIAMMVETTRGGERRRRLLAWTALGGICILYALAFVEFFWGSDLLGLECADVPKCLEWKKPGWHWKGLFSAEEETLITEFAKHGGVLNATVIGEAYGLNRLGLFGILAYAFGMGIVLNADGMRSRSVAAGLVTFVLLGVMLSGSRSATLVIGGLWGVCTALVVLYGRKRQLVGTCIAAHLVIFAVLFALWVVMPPGITAIDRLVTRTEETVVASSAPRFVGAQGGAAPEETTEHEGGLDAGAEEVATREVVVRTLYEGGLDAGATGRLAKWRMALDAFRVEPLGGMGFRMFALEYRRLFPKWPPATDRDREAFANGVGRPWFMENRSVPVHISVAGVSRNGGEGQFWFVQDAGIHSGYLKVLSEAGLLGSVPFLALLAYALMVMLGRGPGLSPAENVWRVVFLSAFVGMLTVNVVDTHSEDRYFWMVLGFAAVLEGWRRRDHGRPEAEVDGARSGWMPRMPRWRTAGGPADHRVRRDGRDERRSIDEVDGSGTA